MAKIGLLTITFWILLSTSSTARELSSACGPVPSLSNATESSENTKKQLESKADLLSKFAGTAELEGKIEATKKTIYQSSDSFYAAQKEAYLAYMFCNIIMSDNSLTSSEKLDAIQRYRNVKSGDAENKKILPDTKDDPNLAVWFGDADKKIVVRRVVINNKNNNEYCDLTKNPLGETISSRELDIGDFITVVASRICNDPVIVDVYTNFGIMTYSFN